MISYLRAASPAFVRVAAPLGAMALLLSACGSDPSTTGTLNGEPKAVATLSTAQIDAGATSTGLIGLSGPAACGVSVSSIDYDTVGGKGEGTNGTAAIMVPTGSAAACSGARPIVLYGHGTTADKNKNMSNVTGDGEAGMLMTFYAAQGFIVVAPNYAGYNGSTLPYHPYLNAEQQSQDMVDALRAAKSALSKLNASASSKLFVTGYSQGGHVAMATVRAIQTRYAGDYTVTGSVPMSGPYALLKMVTLPLNNPALQSVGASYFTPMVVDSYQNAYGNLYTAVTDIYAPAYAPNMVGLFPAVDVAAATAKLPAGADGTYRTLYDQGNGQPYLINTAYATAARSSSSAFQQAFARNDLTAGWLPSSPMALCYGADDPTVPGFNSTDAQTAFAAAGVVQRWNLEDAATLPAGTAPLKAGFDNQKASGIAAAGGGAQGAQIYVASKYHGELVPPFCTALAQGFFRQLALN